MFDDNRPDPPLVPPVGVNWLANSPHQQNKQNQQNPLVTWPDTSGTAMISDQLALYSSVFGFDNIRERCSHHKPVPMNPHVLRIGCHTLAL